MIIYFMFCYEAGNYGIAELGLFVKALSTEFKLMQMLQTWFYELERKNSDHSSIHLISELS